MAERDALEGVRHELIGESALSLGLAAQRMVAALAALRAHDAAGGGRGAGRQRLVAAAGERVWYYVIQRESLGWTDTEAALAMYDVPAEVRVTMGRVTR